MKPNERPKSGDFYVVDPDCCRDWKNDNHIYERWSRNMKRVKET